MFNPFPAPIKLLQEQRSGRFKKFIPYTISSQNVKLASASGISTKINVSVSVTGWIRGTDIDRIQKIYEKLGGRDKLISMLAKNEDHMFSPASSIFLLGSMDFSEDLTLSSQDFSLFFENKGFKRYFSYNIRSNSFFCICR